MRPVDHLGGQTCAGTCSGSDVAHRGRHQRLGSDRRAPGSSRTGRRRHRRGERSTVPPGAARSRSDGHRGSEIATQLERPHVAAARERCVRSSPIRRPALSLPLQERPPERRVGRALPAAPSDPDEQGRELRATPPPSNPRWWPWSRSGKSAPRTSRTHSRRCGRPRAKSPAGSTARRPSKMPIASSAEGQRPWHSPDCGVPAQRSALDARRPVTRPRRLLRAPRAASWASDVLARAPKRSVRRGESRGQAAHSSRQAS